MPDPTVTAIVPPRAVEGGRIAIHGDGLPVEDWSDITVGGQPVRVSFASSRRLILYVPGDVEGGTAPIKLGSTRGQTVFVSVGSPWATGLHQVDNPVFDEAGNLFVTYSGSRGQEAPVSIFRVTPGGTRETFASGIVNATSMAFGPDRHLYVSSRFEGAVYRIGPDGTPEQVATDLGVACGIAFDAEGTMFVGDRSGTIFRVREGKAEAFAALPASVAAFHLAMSPWGELFVSAPTLGSYDHVYRIDRDGQIRTIPTPLGRPQGLTFSPDGTLNIVDALAGSSGLDRFADLDAAPELVVASNNTAYRFDYTP